MAGLNGVFPNPFASLTLYDHLNAVTNAGDLVRLDVGCEWNHYGGDLGRTVPVSGRYTTDQREIWNIFVSAYHAGVKSLREGATVDQIFEAWRAELIRHRQSARPATRVASLGPIAPELKRPNSSRFWRSSQTLTGVPPGFE
ncbi:MAG TPA: M24 family metallopeptidase [Bryobacteraceae bacterium]|nr:M24 family metallopeptidase [Bryobacteraceae bacterium]